MDMPPGNACIFRAAAGTSFDASADFCKLPLHIARLHRSPLPSDSFFQYMLEWIQERFFGYSSPTEPCAAGGILNTERREEQVNRLPSASPQEPGAAIQPSPTARRRRPRARAETGVRRERRRANGKRGSTLRCRGGSGKNEKQRSTQTAVQRSAFSTSRRAQRPIPGSRVAPGHASRFRSWPGPF